jgi:uncharacterized membrane protein
MEEQFRSDSMFIPAKGNKTTIFSVQIKLWSVMATVGCSRVTVKWLQSLTFKRRTFEMVAASAGQSLFKCPLLLHVYNSFRTVQKSVLHDKITAACNTWHSSTVSGVIKRLGALKLYFFSL